MVERLAHHAGRPEGVVHGEVDAGREHRVDEGERVAQQQEAVAGATGAAVGVVAGGVHGLLDQRRALQALGELRAHRDGVGEELAHRLRARLQVVRPADGAHAGRAVGQRDEPEPAVLEPEDRDVAFQLARQALRIAEVAEDGGAVVPRDLLLALQAVREEGVAARGVDDVAGAPFAARTVVQHGAHGGAVGVELHVVDARALDGAGPARGGVAEQQLVELGAPHLPGVGHALVPRVAELEQALVRMVGRDELHAPLGHADALELRTQPELVEQRDVGGEQRLADVEARMARLLQQHDVAALAGEERGDGRAARAAADDQYVAGRRSGPVVVGRRAAAHAAFRAVYSENMPSSTRRCTSSKPASLRACMTVAGGTQASMVSQ